MSSKFYEADHWIVYSKNKSKAYGVPELSARLVHRRPALKADERAVKIHSKIPACVFERPEFAVDLTISEDAIVNPSESVVIEAQRSEEQQPDS